MDAQKACNSGAYLKKLQRDLKWLDEHMEKDVNLNPYDNWQYNNKLNWSELNYFDYKNQFFDFIYNSKADDAAKYAQRITEPYSGLDKFLNERSYVDSDYIYDIVGTLYIREMNYEKATYWLSKVSTDYQHQMNISKEGYFKLDPFRYQCDKKHFISDSNDYKLRFAQEMVRLDKMIKSDAEPNQKSVMP